MPLLTTNHGSILVLLSLSLIALIILLRGAKNTQGLALIQILLVTGLITFRAFSEGALLDRGSVFVPGSTLPGLIIQFSLLGIAFIGYFRKRPLQ